MLYFEHLHYILHSLLVLTRQNKEIGKRAHRKSFDNVHTISKTNMRIAHRYQLNIGKTELFWRLCTFAPHRNQKSIFIFGRKAPHLLSSTSRFWRKLSLQIYSCICCSLFTVSNVHTNYHVKVINRLRTNYCYAMNEE